MNIKLPFIGHLTLQRQIWVLVALMSVSLVFGSFFCWLSFTQEKLNQQVVSTLLSNVSNFVDTKQAGQLLVSENRDLRDYLTTVGTNYRHQLELGNLSAYFMFFGFATAFLSAAGISFMLMKDYRSRTKEADARRLDAELQAQQVQERVSDAKQINDQNQAAILRLMTELQEVADGDLTVHATVSDDITGAIADSVNYTIEELRNSVGRVTSAVDQVVCASSQAEETSVALLAVSQLQLREFSGVVEEIQRLVTLSDEISALVRIEQTATSGQQTELIKSISELVRQQAELTKDIEQHSQHVATITQQTQGGVQQTAQSTRELVELAQELKNSASRFRVKV